MKRIIHAVAPIRICDIGGWTDTWFADHGAVFNIAIYPYVEVQVSVNPRQHDERVRIVLENFNDSYSIDPSRITLDKHPLIEAAISLMEIPNDVEFEVNIRSDAPPGASTGTSAAVSVALIGALDRLTPGCLTEHEVAALAHFVETDRLGLQSGIQDQLCCAYGGINYIEMHRYPHASVSPIRLPDSLWWELENRLMLVYIGTPHKSSEVHDQVIRTLGASAADDLRIDALRSLAREAKNAVLGGNLARLGEIMNANTELQKQIHPALVCDKFEQIMEMGKRWSVLGCKVNGAGGDGGSMTILTDGDNRTKRALADELNGQGFHLIELYLSRFGLRVW